MILGALGMILARKPVHSALCLAAVMISLAVQYAAQDAPFLFAVQIIVYTGAILMLFLFVLMLVGVDSADSMVETIKGQRPLAVLAGLGFGSPAGLRGGQRDRRSDPIGLRGGQQRARRQHPGHRRPGLQPLRLRLRGHVGAADHGRGRRHGAGPPGAAGQEAHPGRSAPETDAPLRRDRSSTRARCPRPASSPGTTPWTRRPCCPTAAPPSSRSRPPSGPAARSWTARIWCKPIDKTVQAVAPEQTSSETEGQP